MQKLIVNSTYLTARKYRNLTKGAKVTYLGKQDSDPNFGFFREFNNPDTFFGLPLNVVKEVNIQNN
jgi:hypothetical protein